MSLHEKLTYHFLRLAEAVLTRLPDRLTATLGSRIGLLLYHRFPVRRREASLHLRMAFPRRRETFYDRLLKRVYGHFCQTFIDALRLEALDFGNLLVVENRACLDEALSEGKGVILLSGHLGNWELIPVWFARNGYDFHPVVQRQKNKGANRFFMDLRRRTGTFPVYLNVSAHEMIRILRQRKILALLSDQDAHRKGVFVKFFGRPASTPKGLAIFHLKTKSPIILAHCHHSGNRTYRLAFERISTDVRDGDPVTVITQRFTSLLETQIRKYPEQYFWFHKRWKTQPIS
ncbi:MAG: lysophospholipid acyltransferase family protein [Fidelibacterota bacterium]